jgi:hypothetical protein
MKQSTKQFEKKFIRSRNAIERKGLSLIKRALSVQYKSFLDRAKQTDFRQWPQLVDNISEEPIKRFFDMFYPMSGRLAVMVRKNMVSGKASEEDAIYEAIFQNRMLSLAASSGQKISTITSTSKDKILGIIQDLITEGELQGWGVDRITSELYRNVGKNLRGNGYARAKAIAQTEMISASNRAAEMAAESTGYQYKKFWSTSGLPGIRPTHIDAENYSNEVNGLMPNQVFPNGLLYPGDPSGPPEEVINCRCVVLHEII